ncbi:peptide transporter family 1-like [Anthonomus grandis grandis]|uniref:peptide transporter family 1-like n=1 Tax=Anthonomus grandis grandis TaxID=2921223 RepID=UPI0021664939|nr:peptide transporter family 1-like [Anthonomus grandis grandis]
MNPPNENEISPEKIPFPKGVFFIFAHTFLERFAFYSIRGVMALYFTNILGYQEPIAKSIYHCAVVCAYFFPLVGGLISDSWLGKFKTIFWIMVFYTGGILLIGLASIDPLKLPKRPLTIFAFVIIAFGTGGVKPCQSAFGGDQFILPQQDEQSKRYFSILYFFINVGSFSGNFLSPYLKTELTCFNNTSCYPLSFGTSLGLLVLSLVIFVLGHPFYRINEPEGNILVNVTKCITYAIFHKKHDPPVDHWLDRAEPKYGRQIVDDIKSLMRILLLFIPLPLFSALFDQLGSGWTYLATRMDGDISDQYTIIPDQMQVLNPVLACLLIPLLNYVIYPLFKKCNFLRTPLKKMVVGGMLAAVSFFMSAVIALIVESTFPVPPGTGEAQLRIYDVTDCSYQFTSTHSNLPKVNISEGYYVNKHVYMTGSRIMINFTFTPATDSCDSQTYSLTMKEQTAYGIYVKRGVISHFIDDVDKSTSGFPLVRTMITGNGNFLTYKHIKHGNTIKVFDGILVKMPYAGNHVISGFHGKLVNFKLGGTYTVIAKKEPQSVKVIVVSSPNSIHILWLLPQYVVITLGELFFYVTGWEFAYEESPTSMKAVVTACFLLTSAFGNLIIVIIELIGVSEKQSNNFFLYAGLMVFTMLVFMVLSMRYKYTNEEYAGRSNPD